MRFGTPAVAEVERDLCLYREPDGPTPKNGQGMNLLNYGTFLVMGDNWGRDVLRD